VAEQRYEAVRAVIADGEAVTDVAARFGVARKTVHQWLAKYEAGGLEPPARRRPVDSMTSPTAASTCRAEHPRMVRFRCRCSTAFPMERTKSGSGRSEIRRLVTTADR
jgi:transposase-like protein